MKLNRILEMTNSDIDDEASKKSGDDDISNTEAWIINSTEWIGELQRDLKAAQEAGDSDEVEDIQKDIEYYQRKIREKKARLAKLKQK